MSQKTIDKLIINDAYTEPARYWAYVRESQEFELREGRRKAGYWKTSGVSRSSNDDPGEFVELELVNKIRPRVQKSLPCYLDMPQYPYFIMLYVLYIYYNG